MKKIHVFLLILFGIILFGNISHAASSTEYIDSEVYEISQLGEEKIATGLDQKNMTAQTILDNFTLFHSTLSKKAYDLDDNAVESTEKLGTGSKIKAVFSYSSTFDYPYDSVTLVLYGDTNGDGDITSADALAVIKNKTGKVKFQDSCFEEAGRITENTRKNASIPSSADALAIIKFRLGKNQITQTYKRTIIVSNYQDLYMQLEQANENIKFDSSTEGKQIEASYNQLKNVVNTYCKSDMSQITKALILHDYLVAGSKVDRTSGKYTEDSAESNIQNVNKTMNDLGFANTYTSLLGIAGIESRVIKGRSGATTINIMNEVTIDGQMYYVSCGADRYISDREGKNEVRRYFFMRNTDGLKEPFSANSMLFMLEPQSNRTSTSTKYEGVIWPEYRKELNYKDSEIKLANGKVIVETLSELKEALLSGKSYAINVVDGYSQELYEIDERCKKILAKYIKPGMTIEEKLLTIHDYICSNFIRTDHEAILEREKSDAEYDCAWGLYKNTILSNMGDCWSITDYFNTLCAYIGLETKSVSEHQVPNPFGLGNHMWSLVKLDGNWYHVDCEGGDFYAYGKVERRWFLYSDDAMQIEENTYEPCTSTKYDDYDWPEFKGVAYYQDVTGIIDEDVPATSIWIDERTETVVGDSYNIMTRVFPYGSTSKVTYTSSNPAIATIDANGNMEIKGKGQATITARTSNGITRSYTLTSHYVPDRILLDDLTLSVGETKQAIYNVIPEGDEFVYYGWRIVNEDFATIDEKTGKVTGKRAGTTYMYFDYKYRTEGTITSTSTYARVIVK